MIASAIATTIAAFLVIRAFPPPDSTAVVLGLAWVGGPFFLASVLALAFSRWRPVTLALLTAVALAGVAGTAIYLWVSFEVTSARQEVATAVLPGEDPSRGPAAMRKSGAEMGSFLTDLFGVAALVVVPPLQVLSVIVATGIGFALSARNSQREA